MLQPEGGAVEGGGGPQAEPKPFLRLPDHVYAQLKWLLANPPNVGAVAALADELADWVATCEAPPVEPFLANIGSRIVGRVVNMLAGMGVTDFNQLMRVKGGDILAAKNVNWGTLREMCLALANMGVPPPPSWLDALELATAGTTHLMFRVDIRRRLEWAKWKAQTRVNEGF